MKWHFVLISAAVVMGAAAAAQPVKMTVATTAFPNTAGEKYWQLFVDRVGASLGDRLDAKYLLYGELGSEENLLAGLRRGRIEISGPSAQATSTIIPEIALLYAPFLFDGHDEADYVMENRLIPVLSPLFEEKGMILLNWLEIGFHNVYGNRPLIMPTDARGLRFRISSAHSARLFAGAIGSDVIPVGFADVVTSLQTGMVEGGEIGVSIYARSGIAREATHLTMTRHSYGTTLIVARKSWFDSLHPNDQAAIRRAVPSADEAQMLMREQENTLLARAVEDGYTVHYITSEQRAAWIEATAPTHEALIDAIGGRAREIYDAIIEARTEFYAGDASGE